MTKTQKSILITIFALVVIGGAIAAVVIGSRDNQPGRTEVAIENSRPEISEPAAGTEGAGPEQAQPPLGPPAVRTGPADDADTQAPLRTPDRPVPGREPAGAKAKPADQAKAPPPPPPGPVQTLERITSGKLGRPAMVELGAEWCPPCREMKPIIEALKKDYGKNVEFLSIDVDEHGDIAEKYNVESIPVQLFFDSKGKQVERHVGFFAREEIVKQFTDLGVKRPN